MAEMVSADREEARKEAILRLKGFNVVGSMETPPTNHSAVTAAGGKSFACLPDTSQPWDPRDSKLRRVIGR